MPANASGNIYINYTDVVLTNATGNTTTITEITDVQVMLNDEIEEWRASGRHFPSVAMLTNQSRGLSISTGDIETVQGLAPGVLYNSAVVSFKRASPSGNTVGKTYTLVNAFFHKDRNLDGKHQKPITTKVTLTSLGGTSDADPLTITTYAG